MNRRQCQGVAPWVTLLVTPRRRGHRLPYRNPPLALVVCEIRFPEIEGVSEAAKRSMRDVVRDRLPLIENLTEDVVEFRVGPDAAGVPTTSRQHVPRLTTRDRTSALVVNPSRMVVETTVYPSYDDFRDLLARSVDAVASVLEPDGVLRIGLRYIDEIRVPAVDATPGNWTGYIDDALLATVSEEFLTATGLTPELWQGVVRYSTGHDSALTVRYGPGAGHAVPPGPTRRRDLPPPGPFFLLDSDSFWEANSEVPEFDPEPIMALCDRLHPPTRAIFEAVSTDKLRNEVYGGYEDPTEEESTT